MMLINFWHFLLTELPDFFSSGLYKYIGFLSFFLFFHLTYATWKYLPISKKKSGVTSLWCGTAFDNSGLLHFKNFLNTPLKRSTLTHTCPDAYVCACRCGMCLCKNAWCVRTVAFNTSNRLSFKVVRQRLGPFQGFHVC